MKKDDKAWEFLNKLCAESDKSKEHQIRTSGKTIDQVTKKIDILDIYFNSDQKSGDKTTKSAATKTPKSFNKFQWADDDAFNLDMLAEPKKITRFP